MTVKRYDFSTALGRVESANGTYVLYSDYERVVRERDEARTERSFLGTHLEVEDCPTFYDGCHCTHETLSYNIKRAEAAEDERDRYKAALDEASGFIRALLENLPVEDKARNWLRTLRGEK